MTELPLKTPVLRMTSEPEPSALHTRPSLLFRLKDWKDEASWTEFYSLYFNLVRGVALKAGLSYADAEEVSQDVFKRVAETIHEFESNPDRGTFRGWLLTQARWRITDKFRSHKPHERKMPKASSADQGDHTRTIERLPAPNEENEIWETEWRKHIFEIALARLARRVPAKHFQVFDLHKRKNWEVLRLSRELKINPASVYLIVHRLTKQLKAEVDILRIRLEKI